MATEPAAPTEPVVRTDPAAPTEPAAPAGSAPPSGAPLLIYDGGCGICSRLAGYAARFASRREPEIAFAAFQEIPAADLAAMGLSRADCERRLRFRAASGRVFGGVFAVNRFFLAAAPPGPGGAAVRALVLVSYALPPLLALEWAAYELFARHRARFGSPDCAGDPG